VHELRTDTQKSHEVMTMHLLVHTSYPHSISYHLNMWPSKDRKNWSAIFFGRSIYCSPSIPCHTYSLFTPRYHGAILLHARTHIIHTCLASPYKYIHINLPESTLNPYCNHASRHCPAARQFSRQAPMAAWETVSCRYCQHTLRQCLRIWDLPGKNLES